MKAVDIIVADKRDCLYVVHSANDAAAKPMLEKLRAAGLKSIRYYGCWQSDSLLRDLSTIFASKELSNHDPHTRLPTPDYYRYSEVV